MSLDSLIKALKGAGDGSFITDFDLIVKYWNPAAEALLKHAPDRIVGKPCYLILRGADDLGNLVCHRHCRVARRAMRGAPVESFDLNVRSGGGQDRWIDISVFTFPEGDNGGLIVHLLRDASQKKRNQKLIDQLTSFAVRWNQDDLTGDNPIGSLGLEAKSLTERETEVLLLLSRGWSTQQIAKTLSISANTARNHIQNILKKFGVHSRLEAVVYANQHELLEEIYQ
jgi:DNA-binding CsgD family transcriptional regulator